MVLDPTWSSARDSTGVFFHRRQARSQLFTVGYAFSAVRCGYDYFCPIALWCIQRVLRCRVGKARVQSHQIVDVEGSQICNVPRVLGYRVTSTVVVEAVLRDQLVPLAIRDESLMLHPPDDDAWADADPSRELHDVVGCA